MKCSRCGAEMKIKNVKVDTDIYGNAIYAKYAYCYHCKIKRNLGTQKTSDRDSRRRSSKRARKRKQKVMLISTFLVVLLAVIAGTCFFFLKKGKNDTVKKKRQSQQTHARIKSLQNHFPN